MASLPMTGRNDLYPIGSIYISVNNTNPSTYFGGTWEAFATGKTLVGIDPNDTSFDTVEETGGEKTHTLTTDEIPSHTHSTSYTSFDVNNQYYGLSSGSVWFNNVGKSGTSGARGGGQAHNNLQPYIVVYMWKRTA